MKQEDGGSAERQKEEQNTVFTSSFFILMNMDASVYVFWKRIKLILFFFCGKHIPEILLPRHMLTLGAEDKMIIYLFQRRRPQIRCSASV